VSKAAIYLRVSTDQQTEESQLKACKNLCNDRVYDVVGVYSDHARSAYKNVQRPEYKKVMRQVCQRQIQHIVIWALDRWTRQGGVELLREIKLLSSYNVQLHSVQESFLDEINIPGEIGIHLRNFLIGFLGYTAMQESDKKSQRIKDSIKFQKALKKGRVGRPTIPDEVIRQVAAALRQGDSYRKIHNDVTYKIKYGKIKHVSVASICKIAKKVRISRGC